MEDGEIHGPGPIPGLSPPRQGPAPAAPPVSPSGQVAQQVLRALQCWDAWNARLAPYAQGGQARMQAREHFIGLDSRGVCIGEEWVKMIFDLVRVGDQFQ